jgi:hypothetical protein
MTSAVPVLAGAVRDQNGAVPESCVVIVFPVEPAQRVNTGLWSPYLKAMPLQGTGTFRLASLPAGEYFVAAIARSKAAAWRDPGFLASVERSASRVTLTWGQTVTRDLTLAVIR